MHLASEVKFYSSFLITTAGCLLMLVPLFLWTESAWCQSSERLLAWWQLLIGALCVLDVQKLYSLALSPLCIGCLLDKQYVALHYHTNLKGPIYEHTNRHLKLMAYCSLSGYLPLQATRQAPAGIPAHLPMPAGRQGTSKYAAKCASPAQWDIHYTAQQRGSASPTGPGRADSRSANVRKNSTMSLWCCVWNSRRGEHRSLTKR